MRQTMTALGWLLIGLLLLAGCSSASRELAGPIGNPTAATESPTALPTQTQTQTPTVATGVQMDLSDPELGIVFDVVPEVTGDAADVYNWMATYEKEVWRTLTTNSVSPALSLLAAAEVQATMEQMAASNATDQAKVGGVFRAAIENITVDGDTATATACDDYGDATFADAKGTYTPAEAGFGEPRLSSFTLVRVAAENRWTIQSQEWTGSC